MKRIILIVTTVVVLLQNPAALATTHRVPADHATIQAGIAAAATGDTVLVAPGTYYENVNYRGKEIVLTSEFALDGDPAHILATVIDGSRSAEPDSGSCVMLLSGEGPGAVLQGFTIANGSGTSYGFGGGAAFFREGGGIILDESQATIQHNVIMDNVCDIQPADQGSGGGGISAIGGSPLIAHNILMSNSANYACGLVLNWAAGTIRNNIVYDNYGGVQFGTGGIMVWESQPWTALIENNTVVGNRSETDAGGISVTGTSARLRNNIVWGNRQATGGQITGTETSQVDYMACNELLPGYGNITDFPRFLDSGLLLAADSPCIDAGSSGALYRDVEDPDNPGFALWPSQGGLRNDIGAYGGPLAAVFAEIARPGHIAAATEALDFGDVSGPDGAVLPLGLISYSATPLHVTSVEIDYASGEGLTVVDAMPWTIAPLAEAGLSIRWQPATGAALDAVISLHHDGANLPNPLMVAVSGTPAVVAAPVASPDELVVHGNHPNPFNPSTAIAFTLPRSGHVSVMIFDARGRMVTTLVDELREAGRHEAVWRGLDAAGMPVGAGTYLYRAVFENRSETGSMTLVK